MKHYVLLIFSLCIGTIQGFSQKSDTTYWHDAIDKSDPASIDKITFTLNDSTYKTVSYWKGKINAIKHTGKRNDCLTPIKKDTLLSDNGEESLAIIENQLFRLNNSSNCDSLVLIKKISQYKKGLLVKELMTKRIGNFADCPCGKWNFYENNKLTRSKKFEPCQDGILYNIKLMETKWSPDKQYKLELYKEQMPFAMPGQGSDHMATIILKDKNGKKLDYTSSNSDDSIMYRDIAIEWDLDKKTVWYGKARLFYLK